MKTEIETVQSSRDAVEHWARGLRVQFLRGALERARSNGQRKRCAGPVLVREDCARVLGDDGTLYLARIWAREEPHGGWVGWLEFTSDARGALALRTENETSQPNLAAVEYWVAGLEPVYFEGAFERARARST
jgi:hypothetical protein